MRALVILPDFMTKLCYLHKICVTFREVIDFSEPQFPPPLNRNNSTSQDCYEGKTRKCV